MKTICLFPVLVCVCSRQVIDNDNLKWGSLSSNPSKLRLMRDVQKAVATTVDRLPDDAPVVVTVYDQHYAKELGTFLRMCRRHGFPHVVGLALGKDAAREASSHSGISSLYVPDGTKYIEETTGHSRWIRIGHMKLALTAAMLSFKRATLVLEMDVVLLRDPFFDISTSRYDCITMYAPVQPLNNRINLGFQLWMPSVNVDSFIDRVLQRTLLHSEWDQGAASWTFSN